MKNFFESLRKFFHRLEGLLLFICDFALLVSSDWNWFISLICAAILTAIFFKISSKWGFILSCALDGAAIWVKSSSIEQGYSTVEMDSGTIEGIMIAFTFIMIGLWIVTSIINSRKETEGRKETNRKAGVNYCKKCGRATVHYVQPHHEPVYYYGSSKDKIDHYDFIKGYYECSYCKHTWY